MSPTDLGAVASAVTQRTRARHQPLLGGLLVKEGLINSAQLGRVLALQQGLEPRPLLGQLLLDQKLITSHELNTVLSKYNREHLLGDVLVETEVITPAQLETALAVQRKTEGPLGETLIQLGFITERQLKHALSIQLRIAFVDLDERPIDPELASLISESYARHHQLIPIARANDRIVVAMADPTDVDLVTELRSCTGCGIDVVTATVDALERAHARAYGARGEPSSLRPPRVEMDETAGASMDFSPGAGRRSSPAARNDSRAESHLAPNGRHNGEARGALAAVRARMDAVRHLARNWERWGDSVDGLLGELRERRREVARLADELRESRTDQARTRRELDAKAEDLRKLETAYAALAQERQALERSLGELQERHDALLRDRRFAIDHLEAALERLRS